MTCSWRHSWCNGCLSWTRTRLGGMCCQAVRCKMPLPPYNSSHPWWPRWSVRSETSSLHLVLSRCIIYCPLGILHGMLMKCLLSKFTYVFIQLFVFAILFDYFDIIALIEFERVSWANEIENDLWWKNTIDASKALVLQICWSSERDFETDVESGRQDGVLRETDGR